MRIDLALQPYADSPSLREVLLEVLADERYTSLRMVTAWVRASALPGLDERMRAFRARGGRIELTSGLSQGAATRAGLAKSLALVDESWVVFDADGRTFHPKVHLARGEGVALLFIGSQNLTAGGLSSNAEAGVVLRLEQPDDPWHLADEVDAYLDRLHADAGIARRLDEALLERLEHDPIVALADRAGGAVEPHPLFDAVAGDVRPLPKGAVPPASRLPRRPWWQRLLRRDEG
ncbi:MAG: phospholipase D family protein [Microbacteriaceae bacterium]|jgi:phosphatidylserine/phosphatidylglycerophosphate/cardiolipin synthase-like enzyme